MDLVMAVALWCSVRGIQVVDCRKKMISCYEKHDVRPLKISELEKIKFTDDEQILKCAKEMFK